MESPEVKAMTKGVLYPIFLDLRGRKVLVVGGGKVALRKVRGLRGTGAHITVVAPEFHGSFKKMAGVRLLGRAFRKGDLKGQDLVFATTGEAESNIEVGRLAQAQGTWVNVAAPPQAGSFHVPARIRKGALTLAFSTGGASPAAAKALRIALARRVSPQWAAYLRLLKAMRKRCLAQMGDPVQRRKILRDLGHPRWLERLERDGEAVTRQAMERTWRATPRRP